MDNQPLSRSTSLLDFFPISRLRRNHGLEHATLHVLSRKYPQTFLAGHSDLGGFWIIGDVSPEDIRLAAEEALQRLRKGERKLAVHPNCGTNFVASGTLAGLAGATAMFGAGPKVRDKLERLPLAASLATLALIFGQPLGMRIQEVITTSGDPGGLEILAIKESKRGRWRSYRVETRG